MIKTIIISILIVIVINYIVHFIKDSFTQPMVKYLEVSVPKLRKEKIDPPARETIETKPEKNIDMKGELSDFLMTINI